MSAHLQRNIANDLQAARGLLSKLNTVSCDVNKNVQRLSATREEIKWTREHLFDSLREIENDLDQLEASLLNEQRSSLTRADDIEEERMRETRRFIIESMDEVIRMRQKLIELHLERAHASDPPVTLPPKQDKRVLIEM